VLNFLQKPPSEKLRKARFATVITAGVDACIAEKAGSNAGPVLTGDVVAVVITNKQLANIFAP
jgi:hypothetical protein